MKKLPLLFWRKEGIACKHNQAIMLAYLELGLAFLIGTKDIYSHDSSLILRIFKSYPPDILEN